MVRRHYGRHFWLIALAVLAFALPAIAQDGMLQGTVKDSKGKPVDGAKITIELNNSGRRFETRTNKNGEYLQVGLLGGQYNVTVEKEGIGTVKKTTTLTKARRNVFDIVLAPGAPADAAAAVAINKAFDEGIAASRAGNQDEAITKFEAAIVLSPACADCYYNIGFAQSQKKDYDKAEVAYKKAIELKADYAEAYGGLANVYNAQRKFDLATEAGAKAAQLSGTGASGASGGNADALFNQGVILWNAGKIADAKKQFEAAIAAKPDHADSHYQLAMALVNEGNLKGAATEFDTYLKLAPTGQYAAQAKALVAQLPK
jgi:tetratricopeptide (TPR) repeat protein